MKVEEAIKFTSLKDCAAPETLEDIALQMGTLADDADIEAVHKVADHLLLVALSMALTAEDNVGNRSTLSTIVTNFTSLRKFYA